MGVEITCKPTLQKAEKNGIEYTGLVALNAC